MKDLFKLIIGGIIGLIGVVGTILSAYSVHFAGLGFVITLIIWAFSLSAISGWWVIGVPILMLLGGISWVIVITVFGSCRCSNYRRYLKFLI